MRIELTVVDQVSKAIRAVEVCVRRVVDLDDLGRSGVELGEVTITRTLFVGLAMIESTAIYCFVVSMIVLFANPVWDYVLPVTGG